MRVDENLAIKLVSNEQGWMVAHATTPNPRQTDKKQQKMISNKPKIVLEKVSADSSGRGLS